MGGQGIREAITKIQARTVPPTTEPLPRIPSTSQLMRINRQQGESVINELNEKILTNSSSYPRSNKINLKTRTHAHCRCLGVCENIEYVTMCWLTL